LNYEGDGIRMATETKILQRMMEKGFYVGLSLCNGGWELQRAGNLIGLDSEIKRLANTTDFAKVFSSLEEISKWIGADDETLTRTIDEYNAACDQGYDHLFLKNRRWYCHFVPHPIMGLNAL
jgi:hypothetical protein